MLKYLTYKNIEYILLHQTNKNQNFQLARREQSKKNFYDFGTSNLI